MTRRGDRILEILAEGRALQRRVMIVVADPDDETIGMGAQSNFFRTPHPGELHYERLGWGITGEIWRRHAQWALGLPGLRSPPWV